MNKKHWISLRFESDIPGRVLLELVRKSYELAKGKLPRRQRMLLEQEC